MIRSATHERIRQGYLVVGDFLATHDQGGFGRLLQHGEAVIWMEKVSDEEYQSQAK